MEGASLMTSFCILRTSLFLTHRGEILTPRLVKNVHKLAIAAGDLSDRVLASDFLRSHVNQRIPETGTAYGKTDETLDSCRDRQPLTHLLIVLSAAENDTADIVASATPGNSYHFFAVFPAIKSFYLPDVRFDLRILELHDGLDHQARTQLHVVSFLVSFESIELRFLRRHQQLEHEFAVAVSVQVIGEPFQTRCLPLVQSTITFRVIAHQHFAESWLEGLDVSGEILAVLEIEFFLAALLSRASSCVAIRPGIAKNRTAKLLINQNSGLLLRHSGLECRLETVIDYLLGGGDLCRLICAQRTSPPKHFRLERSSMVKRQDI